MLEGNFTHLYVYVFALVFGVIGYIDDYQKVKHHQNTGLTAPQKFILQLAAAVAFLADPAAGFITGQVLTADGGFIV